MLLCSSDFELCFLYKSVLTVLSDLTIRGGSIKISSSMKALVTGATGFIGSHLTSELIKSGYDVTCLLRRSSSLRWIDALDVKKAYGDCLDRDSLYDALGGFDYIFHLAGLTKAASVKDFYEVNVKGTENLLGAVIAKNPGVKRFIYISSLAAAGPSANGMPLSEVSKPHPVSDYGKSKLEAEYKVLNLRERLPVTIIRPPAVYGPRDKDFLVFFKFIKKGIFPSFGNGRYSMIYVEDLVRGIIESSRSSECAGEVFFLSDKNIYSNRDIADAISSALGKKPYKIRIPRIFLSLIFGITGKLGKKTGIINIDKMKEIIHPHWVCDSSAARQRFGFAPAASLKEGIKWTADWYRIHRWL